jgi:hypothetical protein
MSEGQIQEYRKYLSYEVHQLTSYITLYRTLHERKNDRIEEMNMAPAFFGIAIDAIYVSIILWTSNLFSPRSERGFLNFLTMIENNIGIFSKKSVMKRKNIAKDDLLFRRGQWKALSVKEISGFKDEISENLILRKFEHRRDKFYAHFDKKYFFNRKRLSEDAPLTWNELDEIKSLASRIFNKCSTAFDGTHQEFEVININDVNGLLDIVKEYREELDAKIQSHT